LIPHHRTGYGAIHFNLHRILIHLTEISGKYTPPMILRAQSWTPLKELPMPSERTSTANEMRNISG
jgi:hypothetical protein